MSQTRTSKIIKCICKTLPGGVPGIGKLLGFIHLNSAQWFKFLKNSGYTVQWFTFVKNIGYTLTKWFKSFNMVNTP